MFTAESAGDAEKSRKIRIILCALCALCGENSYSGDILTSPPGNLAALARECENAVSFAAAFTMKFLYDLFPLLLFFAAYVTFDIFVATAVAIVASILQVSLFWLKHHRFEKLHLVTLAIVLVFGTLTLVTRNPTFVMWKPTLVHWTLAGVMLGNQVFGKKTITQHMLGEQVTLPDDLWRGLNLSWGIFFIIMGALNLYVAFYFLPDFDAATREKIWVYFKVPITLVLTFLFTIVQAFFMAKHIQDKPTAGKSANETAD